MRRRLPIVAVLFIFHAAAAFAANTPHATGRLELTFTERSPLTAPKEIAARLAMSVPEDAAPSAPEVGDDYNLAEQVFDVVVPAGYKPDVPHGVLVWMGVSEFSPKWLDALARHKLIYLAPRRERGRLPPMGVAVDGVLNLQKLYNVDPRRVYLSGFSAGAGTSAFHIAGYPEVFSGALLLNRGEFYRCKTEPTLEPFGPSWKGPLEQIKRETRLVLMWGERDTQYPAVECRAQYDALVLDGFERVTMFIVPGQGHAPPNAAWFEKGIVALDQIKPKKPPTTAPTTQPRPQPGQIAQARRILATARRELSERDQAAKKYPNAAARCETRARKYLQQVLDEYPTTPAAATAREMLDKLDQPAAAPR